MDYTKAIEAAARRHGVNPRVLLAQLRQESGLKADAVSPAGARGIAQFMPGTAKTYGVNLNDGDPKDDIDGAARMMADMLKRFHGSYRKALAAYNAGPGAVESHHGVPPYPETQHYVKTILDAAGGSRSLKSPMDRSPGYSPDRTVSVPGVDRSAERQQLKVDYFSDHSPDALIKLAESLRGARDTPGSTKVIPGHPLPAGGGGGGHGNRAAATILEEFWNGPGAINVKNGEREPKGFVSGHTDHVHVATATKRAAVRLGKLAEKMGLHVGENPAFGGVHPVHVRGSFHYQDKAIDVSGPTELEKKFAHLVARNRKNKR